MASLVPIPAGDITAHYHGLGRKLVLKAEAQIPGHFLAPWFEQDVWTGGLRFSAKAYSGGLGKQPEKKKVSFELELPILLPLPYFNNKSVLVQTASGLFPIDIKYIEWPEPKEDDELTIQLADDPVDPKNNPDQTQRDNIIILPPTDYWLILGGILPIPAKIPKEISSWVKIEFNPEFIKLVDTQIEEGFIKWLISWIKLPAGTDDPQTVNVVTTIRHDILPPVFPPISPVTKIIKPFLVHSMYSYSEKKE
ncbi:hypothetical protein FBEOM_2024 [Fusarium beomiforme]|uniref:Uncharacterized protein n=1 Tax=Fusarium beomiforme TaxID=44412 RepID=A0A9P5AS56_9HYPO|nr:hypothetical protein FBEOM_2024 [Fusarium beomiforme]